MSERRLRTRMVRGSLLVVALAAMARGALADGLPTGGVSGASGGAATGAGTSSGASSGSGAGSLDGTPRNSGPTGAAPSVLPATGVATGRPDVRLGDLGQPAQAQGGDRPWSFTPSVGLSEAFSHTTGAQVVDRAPNQLITTVSPSFIASGDSERLHGTLSYAPQVSLYTPDGDQNQLAQNFNARLLAELLPQTLFLDLRASGSVQSVATGQGPSSTSTLNRGNSTQNYDFSASPYAVHRFGPWGTAEIGGTVARSIQGSVQQSGFVQTGQAAGIDTAATNQNATFYGGHAAFTTGEAFSRYAGAALAQTTQAEGTGVLRGAYRDIVSLDNGYAITHGITLLAMLGYEHIHYAGTDPLLISDATWSAGVRLTPDPFSTLTVRYGHHDGFDSASVDGGYQISPRVTVYARYSSGLTTQAELLQNALATSDLDTQGNPVDHLTGAPLVPVDNFFGTQNSLFKTTTASLTAVWALPRDSFSAGVNSQQQQLVSGSSAAGLAAGGSNGSNSSGIYGSISWAHQLGVDLQSTLYAQYGTNHLSQSGIAGSPLVRGGTDQQSLSVSAALSYALTRTLSGQAQVSYNQVTGGQVADTARGAPGSTGSQGLLLLSVLKSF